MSSISLLPDSASRQLSAHVAVVTPVMLVKELLDNAIDAKASSVEITMSHDTISKIQVRDNGVGIHPADYGALARRGYTSKLKNIEDLASLVGSSLGFRGEALANVNTIADITITTKTSTEPIAAILQLLPNEGGILKQSVASAPVGTTVCVSNIFSRQPVREKMAVKEAKKTLDKVQELLRSYAMARPQLRLHLKVLQPSTKIWSYSPKPKATPMEALVQLFGTDLASRCSLRTLKCIQTRTRGNVAAELSPGCFILEALIVKPGAETQKTPKRHYFSVDGRPLDSGRGIAKKFLKIYSERLRQSVPPRDVHDYFIRLDIRCPPGSYDANIEPSKDDVLFLNDHVVLDAFIQLCSEVCQPATTDSESSPTALDTLENDVPVLAYQDEHNGLIPVNDRILSKRHASGLEYSSSQIKNIEVIAANKGIKQIETISELTPISPGPLAGSLQQEIPRSTQHTGATMLNQWEVDRPDNLEERPNQNHKQQHVTPQPPPSNQGRTTPNRLGMEEVSPCMSANLRGSRNNLLNPNEHTRYSSESMLTPDPPILRHVLAPPGDLAIPRSQQHLQNARLSSIAGPKVPGGPYRNPMSRPLHSQVRKVPSITPDRSQFTLRHQHQQPPWTPPSSVKKKGHSRDVRRQPTDGLSQTHISFGGSNDTFNSRLGSPQSPSELEAGSAARLRNMVSTARQHLQYQMSQPEDGQPTEVARTSGEQPHTLPQRRQPFDVLQTNTFGNNEENQDDREPVATTLPTGDPRAYLLRRQKSLAAEESGEKSRRPLRRMKSALMPLESIPPEQETHTLLHSMNLPSSVLNDWVGLFREYDGYIVYGTLADGLDMSLASGQEVELRLKDLLTEQKENVRDGSDGGDGIAINLQSTLKGKGVTEGATVE